MKMGYHRKKNDDKKDVSSPGKGKNSFFHEIRKRKIIETLAAYIGGGWLIIEVVHWILIDHYHFPEKSLDITIISLLCALICTLIWRWFRGIEKRGKTIKLEYLLMVPIIFTALFFDVKLLLKPEEPELFKIHAPEKISEVREKNSLGILYFENNTGDENLEHWRKALCELIIADLSQSRYIHVLSGDRLYHILKNIKQLEAKSYSSEVLQRVAAIGNVAHILRGSYAKAGDYFRINAMIQEADTGNLIGSESVEGKGEESIFPMVDDLSKRIKSIFKLSKEEISTDFDKDVGRITTASPEAYKHYIEGRKHLLSGDDRKSIQSMEKAVALDPEFAMAYRSMAMSYSNLGYESERVKFLQKALELTNRLSDRERHLIQGDFLRISETTFKEAIEAYEKVLEVYPEDGIASTNLGGLYLGLEQWEKAIEMIEWLIQHREEGGLYYLNLATAYDARGMYEKAKEILEIYIDKYPPNILVYTQLALIELLQGKYDLALSNMDKSSALSPTFYNNFLLKGCIYICRDDLIQAEKEFQKTLALKEQVAHVFGRLFLAHLYLHQGKLKKAQERLREGINLSKGLGLKLSKATLHENLGRIHFIQGDFEAALAEYERAFQDYGEADSLSGQRNNIYLKGRVYLAMKSLNKAQNTADELKEMIKQGLNPKEMRIYHHLQGQIELEKENLSKALDNFKKAMALLPSQYSVIDSHAMYMNSLALAYYNSGYLDRAQEEYEKIISLTTGRLFFGDLYVKSFYMLGRICQERGWPGKAMEYYKKFLELWKDADPVFPEVDDAQKKLLGLKTQ